MKKKTTRFVLTLTVGLALTLSLGMSQGQANPVARPGESASLAMNTRGDLLAVGSKKILSMRADGTSSGSIQFAWPNAQGAMEPSVSLDQEGNGLICSPAGIVRAKFDGALGTLRFEALDLPRTWPWSRASVCASVGGNRLAVLFDGDAQDQNRLVVARVTAQGLIQESDILLAQVDVASGGQNARLISSESTDPNAAGFLLVDARGRTFALWADKSRQPEAGLWSLTALAQSTLRAPSSTTAYAAREGALLRAGDDGVTLSRVESGTLLSERVPVNPCAEEERCGVSLAHDGSWFVCGTWGCYLGRGTAFRRLPLAALGEEAGTLNVAHASEAGRFAYFGIRDADLGTLPGAFAEKISPEASVARGDSTLSLAGWTRPRWQTARSALQDAASFFGEAAVLFPYTLGSGAATRYGAVVHFSADSQSLDVLSSGGPGTPALAAWERAVAFAAPLSEDLGSEPWRPEAKAASLWWRSALRLDETLALALARGLELKEIKVGIIDSGLDLEHPYLRALLPGDGYDFVDEDETPQDEFGHGTHVAALLSSRTPQGEPFGVAPNARLVIARALDRQGRSDSVGLARALAFSAERGARLVNCSWGGGVETQVLNDAFAHLKSKDILILSSAGNDALDMDRYPQFPKNFPGVLNTGATTPRGDRARFSNFGKTSVFLYAPGDEVLSALPNGSLGGKSGTSMASPLTAGTAALLFGAGAQPGEVESLLCDSARKDTLALARSSRCGELDPFAALDLVLRKSLTR